jgi:cytochrome P450
VSVTTGELESLPLFEGCAPEDLNHIVDAVSGLRHVVEGEVICAEGDKADRWWIVVDGMADVTIGGLYTATIGPGETIGELALLDGEPRAATVKAATDMTLHEVDGDVFLDALLASPRLSIALLRELATRLREANSQPPPPARIAHVARPRRPRSSHGQPTEFDPRTPGFTDDPSIHLAAVREAAAVHWSEAISSYVVTRYEDVHRLTRDRSVIGSATTMDVHDALHVPGSKDRRRPGYKMMIRRDGNDHLRLRRIVSKVFTPRAISQWQQRAESIVDRLLAAASERANFDVIADYALALPVQVITEMLGMSYDDQPQLRAWSRAMTTSLDPFSTPEEKEASKAAGRAIGEYLEQVIDDKRSRPSDDLLTTLIEAEHAGDVLDDNEVVAQVVLLFVAGHETTLNLIGNGVTHLLRFPDQLERLHAEPGLDANAIEEVLRFESPVQLTRRISLEPLEIGGVTVPAGSHITLSTAAANRDPRKWGPTADLLDIARHGANEHFAFGGGPHFCLGSSLARLEGKVALPRLLRRFPKMAPAYDEPAWSPRVALRGVDTLPVTLR